MARRLIAGMAVCCALGALVASVEPAVTKSDNHYPAEITAASPHTREDVKTDGQPQTAAPTIPWQQIDRRSRLALSKANTAYDYVQARADYIENQLSNVQRLEQQVSHLQTEVAALRIQVASAPRPQPQHVRSG